MFSALSIFAQSASAIANSSNSNTSSGGSGSGTVSNCGTAKAIGEYTSTGTTIGCNANLTIDANGNAVNTAGYQSGSASGNSGYTLWNGQTSGGGGIGAAAVAGSPILYLMPSTAGVVGQALQDTGVVTCPSLPSGAPTVCHQMVWSGGTAMVLISDQIVSGVPSIAFNSIPQGYKNLVMYFKGQSTCTGTPGNVDMDFQFNGDTGANYNRQYILASQSGNPAQGQNLNQTAVGPPITCSNAFTNGAASGSITINDYTDAFLKNTTVQVTYWAASNQSSFSIAPIGTYWASTAAVTSILVFPDSSTGGTALTGRWTLYATN